MRTEITRHGRRAEDGRDRTCYTLGDRGIDAKKSRELISDLENAGFENRGGKGSHRNFSHPKVGDVITVSGKLGDDAKKYQERIVKYAIEESQK